MQIREDFREFGEWKGCQESQRGLSYGDKKYMKTTFYKLNIFREILNANFFNKQEFVSMFECKLYS